MSREMRLNNLKKMLENSPDDLFLNYALAMELLAQNDSLAAENQLIKVLELNPEYLPVFYQLGKLSESKDRFEEAIKWYQKGISLASGQKDFKTKAELQSALDNLIY